MCYLLRVATPLTLSEVRAMLPAGITADPRDTGELAPFRSHLHEVQTVVALLHGACSCDLATARAASVEEDDAELRRRYRALGVPRSAVIRALERHARAQSLRKYAAGHWPLALNRFVAEHARNAGPTLYHLTYVADPASTPKLPPVEETLAVPERQRHDWLVSDRLLRVVT